MSRFPETNLRTYVRVPDGTPGIWFFSVDAARIAAVAGARLLYALPYHWSRMEVTVGAPQTIHYRSYRELDQQTRLRITVRIGSRIEPTERELFLTARFRLYTHAFDRLWSVDVEHEPWPLYEARIQELEQQKA